MEANQSAMKRIQPVTVNRGPMRSKTLFLYCMQSSLVFYLGVALFVRGVSLTDIYGGN